MRCRIIAAALLPHNGGPCFPSSTGEHNLHVRFYNFEQNFPREQTPPPSRQRKQATKLILLTHCAAKVRAPIRLTRGPARTPSDSHWVVYQAHCGHNATRSFPLFSPSCIRMCEAVTTAHISIWTISANVSSNPDLPPPPALHTAINRESQTARQCRYL